MFLLLLLLLLLLFNVVKNLILAERLVGTMVSEAGDLRSAISVVGLVLNVFVVVVVVVVVV